MNRKTVVTTKMIMYGACAAIWAGKTVLELLNRTATPEPMSIYIMDGACSVLWCVAFFFALRAWKRERKAEAEAAGLISENSEE